MFAWESQEKPIVALSPMADMTDSAFCRVAKRLGAPIVFREMISSEAVVRGNDKTLGMADFHQEERPIIQQLFGSDPATMAEATRIIDERVGPDGFDINMGCPVYKITSNFNGAALMKEPETATNIIRAMKAATSKPVSVKIRLGWQEPTEALEFIRVVEAAGASLVTVHGRTKAQGYSGVADWDMIGRAKKNVAIPVLANGDIHTPEASVRALAASGCDGVLIARGALGNPWIFGQIAATLRGQSFIAPTPEDRAAVIREHARLHILQPECRGSLITFRKHLVWYFKGIRDGKMLRERVGTLTSLEHLEEILAAYLESAALAAKEKSPMGL